MGSKQLGQDQIERRLRDNIQRESTDRLSSKVETEQMPFSDANPPPIYNPMAMTFIQRLRYNIVTNYLHKINLTTYRRLKETYAIIDELKTNLTRLVQERDEIGQTLRSVVTDRDRLNEALASQTQQTTRDQERVVRRSLLRKAKLAQVSHELGTLRAAYEQLQQYYEMLRTAYAQVSPDGLASFPLVSAIGQASRPATGAPQEATFQLPFTVKMDTSIPHAEEVDKFLESQDHPDKSAETDALYFALETSFRGSKAEIKARQREYLPHLKIVDPKLPVVDLGCGRGEFLELMREQGILAVGVDLNSSNIAELQLKQFDVHHADVLDFLDRAQPDSLSAITAFQVIEHISHDDLRRLVQLSYEKLAPGGFVLLETVNPYCLETYRTYYLDPTHRNPVPKDLLTLLYHFYGFRENQLFFQSPIKPMVTTAEGRELSHLYQGYALMGIKPR